MDEIKTELEKLKDKVYIKEMERNLDFAREFLAKVEEYPDLLDTIPDDAVLIPYPVPLHNKEQGKAIV
jgi:hypothetical protein